MFKHWEFWFAIIGAIVSGCMMFFAQKVMIDDRFENVQIILANQQTSLAVQQNDLKYIREDVAEIKEALHDNKPSSISERLAGDSGQTFR